MPPVFRSSGDLAADRRWAYARALADEGDVVAAADLFGQVLDLVPTWLPALQGQAEALVAAGRIDEATAVLRRMVDLDPVDEHGAGLRLAALGAAPTPPAPPPAFVRGLFDAYADRFDTALVNGLHYRAPDHLAAMIGALHPSGWSARVLDLGCGTGLMGERLRGRAGRLDGVDLSPEMIARARARALYDGLAVADVVDHLRAGDEPLDLVVAADVFVYLGDLGPVLAAAAARLAAHGRLYFTVEAGDGDGFSLRDSLRYAHAPAYVRAAVAVAGLAVVGMEAAVLRLDRGEPIHGLVVAARPGPSPAGGGDSVGGEAA